MPTPPWMLDISAGLLIGFALSCCSFNLVIGALGKLVPPEWRMLAFGAGTAAGSFGQFLFSPLARVLIDQVGWQNTLVTFGVHRVADPSAVARDGDAACGNPSGDGQARR